MQRAFVFSLDAFVALMLILLAINSAISLSSVPKDYFPALEQAHDLAKDTLLSMRATQFSSGLTYLDAVISGGTNARIAISQSAEKAIPMQFGYRFDRFNAATSQWEQIYDSQTDSAHSSPRYARQQKKLSASYRLFVSSYDVPLNRGSSPYCYISCSGAQLPQSPAAGQENAQAQQYSRPTPRSASSTPLYAFGQDGLQQEGEATPSLPFQPENQQAEIIGQQGAIIPQQPQAEKTCMSPCDTPRSLYSDGSPFIGQIRLTVYS